MTKHSFGWVCAILSVWTVTLSVTAKTPERIQPATFWPFERCENNTTVLDAMRSGHNGQLIGATVVDAGYSGRALSFDGIDDSVVIDNSDDLLTGDTWSVSFWFRRFPQSPGGESRLRVMMAVGDARNFSISAVRGEVDELYVRINESDRGFEFPFDMGWHHVVVVRDSDKLHVYVDRKPLGSIDADTITPAPMHLGHDGTEPHPSRHFNGLLDEVQIFDRALTPIQIAGMYELDPPVVSVPFIAGNFGGDPRYGLFRIPVVITATDGTVLAISEGRSESGADYGNIDLVLRRSTDRGLTWEPLQVIWDDALNTCGNPTPVVDRDTGRIWMIACHSLEKDTQTVLQTGNPEGGRTVWKFYSDDHGKTWSTPVEITDQVKDPDWLWYATGPGVGIQLQNGRLVIPATRNKGSDGGKSAMSHVIYSDDHGETWHLEGEAGDRISEAQVVELADDRLLLSARRVGDREMLMCQVYSSDRGATWSEVRQHPQLISPGGNFVGYSGGCQASMLRYTRADQQDRNRLIFTNPANQYPFGAEGRVKMTIRLSYDEAESWPFERQLHSRWSAYSCLTVLDDLSIGALYSWGDTKRYQRIIFERVNLPWLTSGYDQTPSVPMPPEWVRAETDRDGKITVRWAPTALAEGWRIYRYVAGAPGTAELIADLPADREMYIDQSAPAARAVYYRAEPYNTFGRPPFVPVTSVLRSE
ncbi:MAG: exo-alpha-sialidase [Phycisphaerales bacterium]